MGRKKVISVIRTKETQYGYEPLEPKIPREAKSVQGTVPVREYVKKEEKPGVFSRFARKKVSKTPIELGAEELSRAADILEGD